MTKRAITKKENAPIAKPQMQLPVEIAEKLMIDGDLAGLDKTQKIAYYNFICDRAGVDPAFKPFDFIALQGKLVLYARKSCTDMLRKIHGVSVISCETKQSEGMVVCTVNVKDREGRADCGIGAVSIRGETGEKLANLIMKAESKAKRRATLSICGLGMLDESEIGDAVNLGENHSETQCKTAYLLQGKQEQKDQKPCRYVCQKCDREFNELKDGKCPHCFWNEITDREVK